LLSPPLLQQNGLLKRHEAAWPNHQFSDLEFSGAKHPMTPDTQERIAQLVQNNKIMIFMKGNKLMPQCGFSNNVVQILNLLGVPYETFDVLNDAEIRQGIKDYSQWPTIPQVYINGEFVGGSDILIELYQNGELQQMVEVALAS
jgi:monothiol glutaredoxin